MINQEFPLQKYLLKMEENKKVENEDITLWKTLKLGEMKKISIFFWGCF